MKADEGVDGGGKPWEKKRHRNKPNTPTRCALMLAESSQAWNGFKPIFADHWPGFKQFRPRDDTLYYDDLVAKMLGGGNPDKMGSIEYRWRHGGQGKHLVSMRWKSSLCLRCAKVSVDHWVSQVSKRLHDGVMYRPIVLTVPDR